MSGHGLTRLGRLPAARIARVCLHNARRGFGKLSQYGDRFAMVLEPVVPDEPIRASALAAAPDTLGAGNAPRSAAAGPEAFAITVALDDLARIAAREGYAAASLLALAARAGNAGQSLCEYLWTIARAHGHEMAGYRQALHRLIAYTSPHYIPHPVATEDAQPALVFLAPGTEGSGCADVIPVRVRTGITEILSLRQAWQAKPNPSQTDYFIMCLLGEVHGLCLADLLDGLEDDDRLREMLADRLAPEIGSEPPRFREALGLSASDYQKLVGSRR